MIKTKTIAIIEMAASAVVFALFFILYLVEKSKAKTGDVGKKTGKRSKGFFAVMLIAAWFFVGTVITALSRKKSGMDIEFQLFDERIAILGTTFARTTVIMWIIIAAALILGLIFRFIIFPRFDPDNPKGLQNIMELSVETIDKFTVGTLGEFGAKLSPYMFSLAVFMLFCEVAELLGFRPPTADLLVTLAMGLITFVLINYYGIKKKGVSGRIKSLASPTAVVFPIRILSDLAVPVSLACRLFGNMVGGMIVMHLLKSVMGGYASGVPAVFGLYFNLFHPLIQAYIFIILSMTFINEAIEE